MILKDNDVLAKQEANKYCKDGLRISKLRDMYRSWVQAQDAREKSFREICVELAIPDDKIPYVALATHLAGWVILDYDQLMQFVQYNCNDLLNSGFRFTGDDISYGEEWFFPSTTEDLRCLINSRLALYIDTEEKYAGLQRLYDSTKKSAAVKTKVLLDSLDQESLKLYRESVGPL